MKVETREYGDKVIVEPSGEVDLDNAPELRQVLLDYADQGQDICVDMSSVSYIDSSGIASLIEALQRAKSKGGEFVIASVTGDVLRVFELARLDQVFTIHANIASAIAGGK